jgi:hypothetical protein
MIYNVNELRKDTVALIQQINAQIKEVEDRAREQGCAATKLIDSRGDFVLLPLLLAKATAYNTLVMLQSQERPSGRGPGAKRH